MKNPNGPIVVVGSINMDLVSHVDRIPSAGQTVLGSDLHANPGGKGANQAVSAARLGWPVHMIGRVGSDSYGTQLRSNLASAGVYTDAILTSDSSSGVALIVVSSTGENSIVVSPGANAHLTPADLDANLSLISSAGLVLAQLEIPLTTVEHLAILCQREGIPLILDPAPATHLAPTLLHAVSWFTPNETEAAFYTNAITTNPASIAAHLQQLGCANIVLKLGARGAFVSGQHIPAPTVQAVDTTAAGDCFNGAFAVALMRGLSPAASAHFAIVAASISVTRAGAQSSMPTSEEVQHSLSQQSDVK